MLPLAVAVLGTQAAPDGRTAHRFAADWLRFRVCALGGARAGRVVALEGEPVRWDGELAVRWDADARRAASRARARAGARDVQRADRAARPQARARATATGDAVVLCPGAVLEVRP